jgi:hypothetical protein
MTNIARSIGLGIAASFEFLAMAAGATLISLGAWWIYRPAGVIVAGVLIIAGTIFRGLGETQR